MTCGLQYICLICCKSYDYKFFIIIQYTVVCITRISIFRTRKIDGVLVLNTETYSTVCIFEPLVHAICLPVATSMQSIFSNTFLYVLLYKACRQVKPLNILYKAAKEVGQEWYQSSHYNFAYKRRYFLGQQKGSLLFKLEKRFQSFGTKKGASILTSEIVSAPSINRQNYDPCQYGIPSLNISPVHPPFLTKPHKFCNETDFMLLCLHDDEIFFAAKGGGNTKKYVRVHTNRKSYWFE